MAFCPHCGKQVTEQASKCISCGNDLDPKAKAARFKGTMMMTPATGPGATAPKPAMDAVAKAPEAPAKAAAPPPAAAAPKAPTPGPSKVMKATMLGTGGAGLAPPMATPRAVTTPNAPAQVAPPPAARAVTTPNVPAQIAPPPAATAPVFAPTPSPQEKPALAEPAVEKPSAPKPTDVPFADERTDPDDSQRFLVGDPMAPAQPAPRVTGRGGRDSDQDQLPLQNTGRLLALGAAGLFVIALVGYLAARFMGLTN
jgi:predicted RNA-binding Zn-ribbon protein involved in translation (DUF1610 family)